MKPRREEEYQRFLGFPASILPWRSGRPEEPQPDGGSAADGTEEAGAWTHPVLWVRWRMAVARRGPFTPDFPEFCREQAGRT